jgi:hypothetical protein
VAITTHHWYGIHTCSASKVHYKHNDITSPNYTDLRPPNRAP